MLLLLIFQRPSTMPACPVCETVIDGDDALARHVNAHFGDESQGGGNNDTNDVQYIGEG